MKIIIRTENEQDIPIVDTVTREAFWNVYAPGADEHYLTHILRKSSDFIPELNFVATIDGKIVGNIMFSHSHILRPNGSKFKTITFGPISVLPAYQQQGVGTALIRHSIKTASQLGYKAILIYGDPAYYSKHGFLISKEFGITDPEGRYPIALQAYELETNALKGITGKSYHSNTFEMNEQEAKIFDLAFPEKEKKFQPSQEHFKVTSQTFL